jgi:hypothetical protein
MANIIMAMDKKIQPMTIDHEVSLPDGMFWDYGL